MHLEMKTRCEKCRAGLEANGEAYICSYECTYCAVCASDLLGVCSNCGGELIRRPRRKIRSPDSENAPLMVRGSQRPWLIWVGSFGVWTVAAVVSAVSMYQFERGFKTVTLRGEITIPLINYLIFAFLTPLVFYFGLRYPVQRNNWVRRTPLYLVGAFVFTVLHVLARALVYPVLNPTTGRPAAIGLCLFRNMLLYNVADDVFLIYLPIVMIVHTLWYYQRFRDRELRASQLEGQLAKAHLQTLKAKLQPHFLFNTMHSISALMLIDVREADRAMTRLSDLLRMSLENDGQQVTTLSRELEFVRGYLEIEKLRLEDRLEVVFDIASDTFDAQVPHLLLQPLVENAVRHGISLRSADGQLCISTSHNGTTLSLRVTDNGPGFNDSTQSRAGLGLAATRERLQTLYGNDCSLDIRSAPGDGVEVCVQIPFRADARPFAYEVVGHPGFGISSVGIVR